MKNQNELFHSDIYLGEEFSEGLYHFKYIDKVFKNGKWKYIYSGLTGASKNESSKVTSNPYSATYGTDVYEARQREKQRRRSQLNASNALESRGSSYSGSTLKDRSKYGFGIKQKFKTNTKKAKRAFDQFKQNAESTAIKYRNNTKSAIKQAKKNISSAKTKANDAIKKYRKKGQQFIKQLTRSSKH